MSLDKTSLSGEEKIKIFSFRQNDLNYHRHDFLELVYITEGSVMHWLDGEMSIVHKGDYFIIDYKSEHMYKNLDGAECELINCLFKPNFIDPILKNCRSFSELLTAYCIRLGGSDFTQPPTHHIFKDTGGEVRLLIEKMKQEYESGNVGWEEIVRCRLIETLILTMRSITIPKVSRDKNIAFAIDLAEKEFTQKISVAAAARAANVTVQYMSARFKSETGMTFTEYVQRLRMELACRTLIDTNKKISDVAELTGYGDVKFFCTVFKRMLGVSPGEFRRLNNR